MVEEEGRGDLRASYADREQAIEMLKAAFTQERLAKDEFEVRVGQAFAARTHAQLAVVTGDIPAPPIPDQPPSTSRVREQRTRRLLEAVRDPEDVPPGVYGPRSSGCQCRRAARGRAAMSIPAQRTPGRKSVALVHARGGHCSVQGTITIGAWAWLSRARRAEPWPMLAFGPSWRPITVRSMKPV
jgi:Domain of unknown function (DUF1707)